MTTWIGIDPGSSSGGIAWACGLEVGALKMPGTPCDVRDRIELLSRLPRPRAVLERVSAMPRQGVSSTFKFGANFGLLQGCLYAYRIPFELVTPGKWQRALGCLSRGDKNVTKRRAQELFPALKITHATADALLLAEYGRRFLNG